MREVYWTGRPPKKDDFGVPLSGAFYDARTRSGPWAIMSPASFKAHGIGTGLGKGQRYEEDHMGRYIKTEG
jgi:hypothetical protein